MNEPVDKMLASRIKQVFEDFEDPTADAGWKELRKKYPGRKRRPLILWLSSAAALFILATGLWFADQPGQLVTIKPAKDEKALVKLKTAPVAKSEKAEKTVIAKKEISDRTPEQGTVAIPPVKEHEEQPLSDVLSPVDEQPTLALTVPVDAQDQIQKDAPAHELPADLHPSKDAPLVLKGREGFPLIAIDPVKKPTYIKEFNPEPIETEDKDENSDPKSKKLALSVFAGSYFNYSEGSENQLNFGAGFVSDIRLSKNLKLSTGMSIASNSLNYDSAQDLPSHAYASFASSKDASSGNLTTITSYHASLLTLDIPVNIKYQFVPESDKFYVSAGLSSGTYLNETYAYQYRNFSTATGSYVSQTQDQKIKKQLNDFDLGRTLNLSLGISTGFGKTQVISIEPFMKYPLGGLGSENLRFGSAGVNLKLRFTPQKK